MGKGRANTHNLATLSSPAGRRGVLVGCWIVLSGTVLARIARLTSMQGSPRWRWTCRVHHREHRAIHHIARLLQGWVSECPAASLEAHQKSCISLYKKNLFRNVGRSAAMMEGAKHGICPRGQRALFVLCTNAKVVCPLLQRTSGAALPSC